MNGCMPVQPRSLMMLTLLVSACAPVHTSPSADSSVRPAGPERPQSVARATPTFWAAFSDEGAVWSNGQQACVARVPALQPLCPQWPGPTGPVAWEGERAWVALPSLGQVVTLDRAAESVLAGRTHALSSTRIYREDGSALNYRGMPVKGTLGQPDAVLTASSGQDYALVAGQLWEVDAGRALNRAQGYLLSSGSTVTVTAYPSTETQRGRLELRGTELRWADGTPLPMPGTVRSLGLVGQRPFALLDNSGRWELQPVPLDVN